MYKISVPLLVTNLRFEKYYKKYIEYCKQAGVERVFLSTEKSWYSSEEDKQYLIDCLKKYVPIFEEQGFEVGVWINTLGHGGELLDHVKEDFPDRLTRMVGLDGHTNKGAYCPTCEKLQELAKDLIRRMGQTGVSMIMLDDDYRYSYHGAGDLYCVCSKHQELISKELGEPFDAKRMKAALTSGGPNRWRDAWLHVQGKTLNDFAKMLRDALDEVNSEVRLSLCAVLSTWDIDGVDALTLAKTMAGNTEPYLRLIGAPYWAALRTFAETNLATVCEYERLQQYWSKDSGVEIFCEGDTYPRPRYKVPAAYLESFEQVMRAAGTSQGILKYLFDYQSSPDFELGYWEAQIDDQPLYDVIHRVLTPKEAIGVTIYEPMQTLAQSHRPGMSLENRCIPNSLRFATDNNIPIRYDAGEDATFIFGDAGEFAGEEQLKHGAVLDITAALAMTRRGFDVGLKAVKGAINLCAEEFPVEDDVVKTSGGDWYEVEVAESAEVDSWLVERNEKRRCPAVYTYENAEGQRFAVYCFHAQESYELVADCGLYRSQCRAKQVRRILPWLSGRDLDAVCDGEPDLYTMVKRDGNTMSVALWNFSVDYIRSPKVRLGEKWSKLICDRGNAALSGNVVEVEKMPAFSFTCFTLIK